MGLYDAIDGTVRGAFCIAGSGLAGLVGIGSFMNPDFPGIDYEQFYRDYRRFRRVYCDDLGPELPDPPFTGGQCPKEYIVYYTSTATRLSDGSTSNGSGDSFGFNVYPVGPISGASWDSPGDGYAYVTFFGGNGVPYRFGGIPLSQYSPGSVSVVSVSPRSGLDDCGNPPPEFPPPVIPPVDVDIDIAPNITVPATFVFAPVTIDVDGRLIAPVTVNVTVENNFDIEVNGNLILAPEVKFEIDPGLKKPTPDTPVEPDGDGQKDPSEPPPKDEPEPSDDDMAYPIVGVMIACSIDPDARPSGIDQVNQPDIYVPRLGSVRFGFDLLGSIYWSEDIDIKGLRQLVRCPWPNGAQYARVDLAHGVTGKFRRIYSKPPEGFPFYQVGDLVTVT